MLAIALVSIRVNVCSIEEHRAFNFALEGVQQFLYGKGHFYKENVNLYWNFEKGTTPKALGIIAMGAEGYFKAAGI